MIFQFLKLINFVQLKVEKLKQDEKETIKLQDSLQIAQLRLATREQHCRTLQEKVYSSEASYSEKMMGALFSIQSDS